MAPISQHVKEELKHNENIEKYIIMRDRISLHHSTVRKSKRKKGEKNIKNSLRRVWGPDRTESAWGSKRGPLG